MIDLSNNQFLFTSPIPSNHPLLSQPHTILTQTTNYTNYSHTFSNPHNPNNIHTSTPTTTTTSPQSLTTYILTLN